MLESQACASTIATHAALGSTQASCTLGSSISAELYHQPSSNLCCGCRCSGLGFFHVCFEKELAMWPRFTYFSQCIWLSLPNIVDIGINYLAGLPLMFFFGFLGFHQAYHFISFNIVLVNSKNKCIIMKGVTSMCS